ncbi:unnamed protein product [Camellia sinensis]
MTDRRCSRQRQHLASANSESSYSGSADESSYSGSSNESSEESTRIIPDPPMSWYPPGSLPSTSSSTGSTHDTTSGHSSRGPTLMHGSDWNPSGGILHIVPNELNQVVDGYTPLASRLGVLARDGNLMPLTYRTWSHVPKENKERIWREIKVNTDADDLLLGTRKAQKKSTKNKEIRKKKTLNHITGKKSFSVVRVEETNKKNGVPATPLEVWMAGYTKDNKPSNDKVVEVMTQMKDLGAQSNATDEEIITQVLGPERPGHVRTYGLGPSSTDVFGGGYRQSQEQTRIIQTQVQEQLNQYKAQMDMQMKEMMDAMLNQQKVQMEMQSTIQAQQARIEQFESQQAMGGPVAPAATHVHSQQQSHAYTSSFNCHRSSKEFTYQRKRRRRRRRRNDKLRALLYRLSGDYNPLHSDPKFAEITGMSSPPHNDNWLSDPKSDPEEEPLLSDPEIWADVSESKPEEEEELGEDMMEEANEEDDEEINFVEPLAVLPPKESEGEKSEMESDPISSIEYAFEEGEANSRNVAREVAFLVGLRVYVRLEPIIPCEWKHRREDDKYMGLVRVVREFARAMYEIDPLPPALADNYTNLFHQWDIFLVAPPAEKIIPTDGAVDFHDPLTYEEVPVRILSQHMGLEGPRLLVRWRCFRLFDKS